MTPLVLIHGSPATGQAWQAVAKHLPDHFAIVTPTLPGHDGAGPAETPPAITTDALAAAVEAELGSFDAPIRLAGHSYGASVALHVALRGRIPIAYMVLFEPVSPHALELAGKDASRRVLRDGIGGYVAAHEAGEPEAVGRMIDFWFGPGAFGAMPEPVKTYLIDRTPVNVRDVRAAFAETYTYDDLARLAFPVQIACGDKSPAVTLDITEALIAGLPQGTLAMIEGGDHAMLTTHPEAVADMIADFSG
ncbi:MAG: alpha/beta hydrolase [Alphaproteobacteria bacterium]|nr:alpha/beta hydrolase [Alphaproteobacteria bacterium]